MEEGFEAFGVLVVMNALKLEEGFFCGGAGSAGRAGFEGKAGRGFKEEGQVFVDELGFPEVRGGNAEMAVKLLPIAQGGATGKGAGVDNAEEGVFIRGLNDGDKVLNLVVGLVEFILEDQADGEVEVGNEEVLSAQSFT